MQVICLIYGNLTQLFISTLNFGPKVVQDEGKGAPLELNDAQAMTQ